MLSSYKVIKSNSVISNGNIDINTEYSPNSHNDNKKELGEKNAKDFIESYEVLARTMLENARRQSDEILASAYDDASRVEQEAYNKGLRQGYEEGHQQGIADADNYYQDVKAKAEYEIEIMNKNAEELLLQCKNEYLNYLEEKKGEIKSLILCISESILKKEVKDKDSIDSMIIEAIEMVSKSKTIIVKCRDQYVESLNEKIEAWKHQSVFRGEVFVVSDDNLEEGNAVIQSDKGKITVSIKDAIEKVREIIISH